MGNICCMAEPQTVPDFAFNPGPFTSDQVSHDKFPPKDLGDLQGRFGKNLGFTGVCQQGLPPWMWGISLSQLQDITKHKDFKSDMTMRQVTDAIIIPKTKKTGLGYALTVNKDLAGTLKPLRAKVMVSHAWDENYLDFLDALATGDSEGPFWVCATAIYQPEDTPGVMIADQLGPDPKTGPFATVLRQASLMVALNTPLCDIYTRMWCILEMYIALQYDVPVEVRYVSAKVNKCHDGSFGSAEGSVLSNPFEGQLPVNCREARCGNPKLEMNADEKMIRKTVESLPGGYKDIDHAVEGVRYTSLQKVKEQALTAYSISTQFGMGGKYDRERERISQFYDNIGNSMLERMSK
eukprot:gnl/TRDRNA2_/TRDRNA2_177494_c1_seq8.p1 gnl/TRDRNA2_/TRDRNA2_177494_c1~~gnl/TRDRNA2_/TRDRNA2_177494_c1_seq8.p1  ORF type:complete len:351 (-),score=58.32 gnl/TRDRNA2_/TRDRNA2_177494_c1_seq8:143-1195(-)